MKKILPFLIGFLLIVIAYFIYSGLRNPRIFTDYERRNVKIGRANYSLYIADTESKRMKGLSEVPSLPQQQGVIFIFEQPDTYGFWMKDMHFSLDFVYIRDGKVTELKENISPDTFPQILYPVQAVDAVIELNAGHIRKSKLHIGDAINISK